MYLENVWCKTFVQCNTLKIFQLQIFKKIAALFIKTLKF